MKKIKKILTIVMLAFLTLVTACNLSPVPDISFERYLDSDPIETEGFTLSLSNFNNYDMGSGGYVMMTFKITNKTYSTQTYDIKNLEIIKEETGAIYVVDFDRKTITIEAEMSSSFQIIKTLPSLPEKDKYKFSFKINQCNVTYFLYEIPDHLRNEIKVEYFVNNKMVYSTTNKEKRKINKLFIYESEDNLKYCDTWYLDESCVKKFDINNEVENDLKLYGKEETMIKWSGLTSDRYSYISGINHIPSNGVLIIPERYKNKDLAISNFAIKDVNLKKIYVPNTVRVIYSNNFKNINNATIYYDGTEEEWLSLFYSSSNIVTANVVYNVKYEN